MYFKRLPKFTIAHFSPKTIEIQSKDFRSQYFNNYQHFKTITRSGFIYVVNGTTTKITTICKQRQQKAKVNNDLHLFKILNFQILHKLRKKYKLKIFENKVLIMIYLSSIPTSSFFPAFKTFYDSFVIKKKKERFI